MVEASSSSSTSLEDEGARLRALRVRAVESRMAAASGEEEDPLPSRKRQRLAANPDHHPSSSSSSSSSGLSPVKIEDESGPHHREGELAQDPATSSSSTSSSIPAAAAPPSQPEAAVVDILDSSEDEGPVDVLEVSSDSDDDEDDDELEAVVEDPIEVDLLDDEDFEAGAAPIAITEDEASEGGHHSDTDHNDVEDDDVEFVGETRAAGANWGLRWQHRNRLDNSALRALDRHLGFNPPVGIQDVFGAPPPPVAHPLPNAFINRANRERLRAGGVRRYNGGNLPHLRDLDTPQPGEGDRPLYAVRYPRGNRQRCEVCRRNISLNSTVLCYRSRLMVKTVHVECAPNSRAMYRPADVGVDVIFQDAVANDEAEVDRVGNRKDPGSIPGQQIFQQAISTLSHLRSRRLMDREGELRRRRNNRRQNGGDLLLDIMRIPPQQPQQPQPQPQPQPVMEDPGRVLGFDNGLHEGLLAYNWLLPGAAAVAGFGPPGHHINMYHSSVAEALLRGRMPQRGPPPPSIPAMLKKCTRVVIKKGDVDPDTNAFRECTICLEPMKTRQAVIELPCEHRYHRGCIEKWFKTASTKDPTNVRCPLDKKSLFEMLGEPVPG